jgi:hypothetical protein
MLRSKSLSFLFSLAIPVAVATVPALVPATAFADAGDRTTATAPRATFTAPFQRYLLMPNGRTMGLMLSDGTFIFTPGRSLHRDAPALTTGTRLEIDGVALKTPTGTIVQRAIVKVDGNVIADASKRGRHAHRGEHKGGEGKERHAKHHHELKPVTGAGQVAAIVSGPKGSVRALVLTDGTTAMAHNLESLGLKVGDRVSVAGQGGVYPLGKSLRIEKITMPDGQTREMPRPVRPQADPGQGPA